MKQLVLCFVMLACMKISYSQSGVSLLPFSAGYTLPLGIENCGDNRLFIVQKTGQIIICDTLGNRTATPFLDISDRITTTGSEQGLLGVAFDPKYSTNGFFYVNYINKSGNTQISRFKVSASNRNLADKSSETFLLSIQQPFENHNGGCMRFGKDGLLYIAAGDGGSGGDPQNNGQNLTTLLGKILRINVTGAATYTIPSTNPFINTPNAKKEIWALGVRNPWRFSFDAATGALVIADVGQDAWEEVDLQYPQSKGGENYGWRCYEGNHPYNTTGCAAQSTYKSPVYEYPHSDVTNDCSITGGFVYRGKRYPSLNGKYFFADYCSGIIRTLTLNNGNITETDVLNGDDYAYTSFGEDKNHELFITNYITGGIYRVATASTLTAASQNSSATMMLYPNPAGRNFTIQYTTTKAEECLVSVYAANGRQVYAVKKLSLAGNNMWSIELPQWVKGDCYAMVSTASGAIIRQNILIH